jgi:23S rRNA (adenine2030-N6)-methyltransferase
VKYRHAFHAGNFADVHKHVTLLACLEALTRKDKGFLYAETHAGAGLYDLRAPAASLGDEAAGGIGRLDAGADRRATSDTSLLGRYLGLVRLCRRETGDRVTYPGSPWIALSQLRAQDRAALFEIDAADCAALDRTLHGQASLRVTQADGYRLLRALLPPLERRALVLIDPPYEDADDDRRQVCATLGDSLKRFATGVYLVWYPMKLAAERDRWLRQLADVCKAAQPNSREWLSSELWVHALDSRASLAGSGMFIANPPFQLAETLRAANTDLASRLAGPHGGWSVVDRL